MSWTRTPRSIEVALDRVRERSEPRTLLAAAQSAWADAAGPGIAAQAEPVAEREGRLTIACRSATWAQELDLMQKELLERLNARLGEGLEGAPRGPLRELRFTADAARHFYS